ncbi:MAG: c-type cytochrome [Methylocystis sp.]|uniref:PQQ-dependent sugar dehydrogenase n=1 Tax=Methylocystis sp. TaxID=1911079 RepID=UPI003DA55A97
MRQTLLRAASFAVLALASAPANAQDAPAGCASDNAGLSLPRGFCATIFADHIGHARHMAVAPNGVVYVNTWSGRYYGTARPPAGGFIVALQDANGDGRAEIIRRFGETPVGGGAGGTGVALYDGALYAEEGDRILRYSLPKDDIVPNGKPQIVVSGLPLTGDHPMHPFAIDAAGNLFVDSASATNSCQAQNRMRESPGLDPCRELETRAGVWRYDARATGQTFSPAERFATGIRNGEGIAIDGDRIYVTQHGRDQLSENWPKIFTREQGPELPAEELVELKQGADYGWPYCYYDGFLGALVLAPEYGGDGGKTFGVCAQKQGPLASFPAHWAPNDLAIYHGGLFPTSYDGGFFIAFHGSWNRAPFPQGGYNIVFQPMAAGKPNRDFIVFADGFAGRSKDPGAARHRPSGVAVGPDGALYVSDDVGGRIWRIVFHGDVASTGVEPAPTTPQTYARAAEASPPEGVNPDAGKMEGRKLPTPPGVTDAEVAKGERIFNGHAASGNCSGCHGENGKGSPLGPDLTSGKWLWGDGSLDAIRKTIADGVPAPKDYRSPMPPKGGAPLTDADVTAVAAYVWAIGHPAGK